MESLVLAHGNGADELGLLGLVIAGIVTAFVLAERSSRRMQQDRAVDESRRSAETPAARHEKD